MLALLPLLYAAFVKYVSAGQLKVTLVETYGALRVYLLKVFVYEYASLRE